MADSYQLTATPTSQLSTAPTLITILPPGGSVSAGQENYDSGVGFWLGNDSGTPKFSIGDSAGNKLTWNGTTLSITGTLTATTGTIGGFTIGATSITATNLTLDSSGQRISLGSTNDIVILDADDATYRLWIGNATAASAPFNVTKAGVLSATGATISGSITSTSGTIGGFTLGSSTLTATNLTLDSSGQRITLGSGNDVVILDADDATYRLWIGNTTPASAPFYVTKAGQVVATNIFITTGDLTNSELNSNTVDTAQIVDDAITAAKINVANLSAIVADMGTITAGTITLDTTGHIKSGQTAYNTGTGFWLGIDSGTPKFSIGNSSASNLTWNGSTLTLNGTLTASSATITLDTLKVIQITNPSAAGFLMNIANEQLTVDGRLLVTAGNTNLARVDVIGSNTGADADSRIAMINQSITTGNALVYIETNGSGDPKVHFSKKEGVDVDFAIGIDNSDGDKFKISRSGTLGTDDALTIDTSNNTTLSGTLTVSGTGTSSFAGLNSLFGSTSISTFSGSATPKLQVIGTTNFYESSLGLVRYSSGGNAPSVGPFCYVALSRGTTGNHTVVQDGDLVGGITFEGSDGDAFLGVAQIRALVDGTPGNNDMPGKLEFWTCTDGSSSPTPKVTIRNTGIVELTAGIKFPATQATSSDANTLDDYEEGTWTPTITAGSGTITTASATGSYTKIGRVVHATALITITTNGTGATSVVFTLPFTTGHVAVGAGRASNGNMLQVYAGSSATTASVFTYNNVYPGADGAVLHCSITYTV